MGYGSTGSRRLGMGNGSMASPRLGWAMVPWPPLGWGWSMAPRFPQGWGCAMAPLLPLGWGMGYGSMISPRFGNGQLLHCFPNVGDGLWLCGIGKGDTPPYVFLGGVWRLERPAAVCIFGRRPPPKDGGLSCAQSCRPASLRETGADVMLLLVEVGVSE